MPTDTLFDFYENKKDTYSTEALYVIFLKSKYKKTPLKFREVFLINIDISIDRRIIFRNLSDRHFVQSTIVHIFHDHIIIGHISNDTNMSIISIIPMTRELDDRTRNRF